MRQSSEGRTAACRLWLAALALALCALGPIPARAGLVAESNDLMTCTYQQSGANEEEAVRLAGLRAVHATIGRLLRSDYGLQGRERLEPYLQLNWQKFVASTYVLERRFDKDAFGCLIRVQTFPEVLMRDLKEKRFLYRPKPTPHAFVFLQEKIADKPVDSVEGRRSVAGGISEAGGSAAEAQVPGLPQDAFVFADPTVMAKARETAARAGAEVLVAGVSNAKVVKANEEILYDKLTTVEAAVRLVAVRVDDGAVLAEADVVDRASEPAEEQARQIAMAQVLKTAGKRITADYLESWHKQYGGEAKFEVMFTDLTPDETASVMRHLDTSLVRGTRARLKSWFGNVAVVSLDTPRDYSAVQRAVLDFKSFDMRITDHEGRRITVDVKH